MVYIIEKQKEIRNRLLYVAVLRLFKKFPTTIFSCLRVPYLNYFNIGNNMSSPPPVIVAASGKQTATIIFLHGLGDTGHGWAASLAAIKPPFAKLICPTASSIPVSLNGNLRMPSWFDLKSLDPSGPEDEAGIKSAAARIDSIIQAEVAAGIPPNRIILGGFSQGGALALYTGLSGSRELGGIIALSSWLPLNRQFGSWLKQKSIPILQCHGDCDPIVMYTFGLATSQLLKTQCGKYTFKTYPGLGHSSSETELEDVKKFFQDIISSA